MSKKNMVKKILDIFMTVILLFLMAYQVTGDRFHEWLGAGMLVLFLAHNGLNYRWYKAIFRGSYSLVRILWTILNLAVLAAILITGGSGIVMSNHVFTFLKISGGTSVARSLHLVGSYWSFVLMSCHLGLHWNMITGMLRKKTEKKSFWLLCRLVSAAIALYGAVRFYQADIYSYMFMKNPFAFLDYSKPAWLVLSENAAMMGAWVFIAYSLIKGLGMLTGKKSKSKR